MNQRQNDIESFYKLIHELSRLIGDPRRLAELRRDQSFPTRGVYFFFEDAEIRPNSQNERRVVRVGTHGLVDGSKSTLYGRLSQHRGTRAGSGNHRGSVFRLHVGSAMIRKQKLDCPDWGKKSNASREVRIAERFLEEQVSQHIGRMEVVWLAVPDEPGPNCRRGYLERNAIGLLSRGEPASEDWLGNYSTNQSILRSHLWNVNHVDHTPDSDFLDVLDDQLHEMTKVV